MREILPLGVEAVGHLANAEADLLPVGDLPVQQGLDRRPNAM
jgi:hypothetical protein